MNRIRELRKLHGLNQSELASIAKVGQQTLSNWEREFTEIDRNSLFLLADYFGVSTDYLLGRAHEPWPKPPGSVKSTVDVPPIAQLAAKAGVRKPKNIKALEKFAASLAYVESAESEIEETLLNAEMTAKGLLLESL